MPRGLRCIAVGLAAAVGAGFVVVAVPPAAALEKRPAISIKTNEEFDAEHGVRSGRGTAADPYVISGWELNNLRIENTDRYVVIRENKVTGQVVLNWVGDRVHVYGNEMGDLRVNQNVRRTGLPTSGTIARNTFGVVGQLRHWDGVFEHNRVGSAEKLDLAARAVNFDGFNGAVFRENTIFGYMDARLHGHHHSSGFEQGSHHHGADHDSGAVDHTRRYHRVSITNNSIRTTANYALSYLDTNHAANDRTAASEQEPALRDPHVHHTRVTIEGNRLTGAGLLVNVFNAVDKQKHPQTARGSVTLRGNRIALGPDGFWAFRDLHGIEVRQARDVDLTIEGNRISGRPDDDGVFAMLAGDRSAGIFVHQLDDADVRVVGNRVVRRAFGVRAQGFTETVRWLVRELHTEEVGEAVSYDESVSNQPAA